MKREVYKITLYLKGEFYALDFFDCSTLKEVLEEYNIKRSQVICWKKIYA